MAKNQDKNKHGFFISVWLPDKEGELRKRFTKPEALGVGKECLASDFPHIVNEPLRLKIKEAMQTIDKDAVVYTVKDEIY